MPLVGVRHQVRKLRLAHPNYSLGDIGSLCKPPVSRQRVSQLLKAEGLPTRKVRARDIFDAAYKRVMAERAASGTEGAEPPREEASNV